MNEEKNRFKEIPAGACTLCVGDFAMGSNGENAKTAPVRLIARSGRPIEHWYWGNVVHDLAGMQKHKPRLPIDYAHDAKEVIGYLNKFDIESGDLVASGALVPFGDSDRATEIIHKMNNGVPYEASINFGGDGIKIQELGAGEVTEVNGFQFEGPGVVIREWPLRGVAICPYGADMNTESVSALSANDKKYSAAVVSEAEAKKEASQMSEAVEKKAEQETPEAVAELTSEVVENVEEVEAVEAPEAEAEEAVEAVEDAEAVEEAVELEQESKEPVVFDQSEFVKMVDEFGAEIAAEIVRDGGCYSDALRKFADKMKAERDELNDRIKQLKSADVAEPVGVSEAKEKVSLFSTGK